MPRDDQSMVKLAGDIVVQDERLRARLKNIADRILDEIEHTLEWGTDTQKQKLLGAFMPVMLKGLAATKSEEDDSKEAEAVQRLFDRLGDRDNRAGGSGGAAP